MRIPIIRGNNERRIVMSLAQKITDMYDYCDQETIAKSLQIPEEIVQGIIDGTIESSSLDDFDPSKPYEIKLVKENGLKIIEQKLDKMESLALKKKKKRAISKAWGILLDGIWLLAVIICVSCAIYGLYYAGQINGFEHPVLTHTAIFIQETFIKITDLF